MALTSEAFLAFYPQFSTFAEVVVLPEYLRQANARFSDFGPDTEEARRLYTAHKLTLYAASCLPEGVTDATAAQIASAGKGSMQEIASKKVGDVSISYATSTSTSNGSSTGLNDLNQTVYGLQLLSLLRLYGFAREFYGKVVHGCPCHLTDASAEGSSVKIIPYDTSDLFVIGRCKQRIPNRYRSHSIRPCEGQNTITVFVAHSNVVEILGDKLHRLAAFWQRSIIDKQRITVVLIIGKSD